MVFEMERRMYSVKLIVGILLSLLTGFVNAAVIESQTITSNTIWSDIGERYEINGTVTVESGVTLTVSPGVELELIFTIPLRLLFLKTTW